MRAIVLLAAFLPIAATADPSYSVAKSWLSSLPAKLQSKAVYEPKSSERNRWDWTPGRRNGIPLKEMDEKSRKLAIELVDTVLSPEGHQTIQKIIEREKILAKVEGDPETRDSDAYYLTLFGVKGLKAPADWGFRFEGHHLSINAHFQGEKLTLLSPFFVGSNPAKIDSDSLLGESVSAVSAFLVLMNPEQEKQAFSRSGIKTEILSVPMQNTVWLVVETYLAHWREDIARAWKDVHRSEPLTFSMSGMIGKSYLYRIKGKKFEIEHDAEQNSGNHIHSYLKTEP